MNDDPEHWLRRARLTPPPGELDARMQALFHSVSQTSRLRAVGANRTSATRPRLLVVCAATMLLGVVALGWLAAPTSEPEIPAIDHGQHTFVFYDLSGTGRNHFDFSTAEQEPEPQLLYSIEWHSPEGAGHAL